MDPAPLIRAVYSLTTLYMMTILLTWLGPWLNLDFRRWKWIPMIADPPIRLVRRRLPSISPVDLAPVVTVLLLWLVRSIAVEMLLASLLRA